MGLNWGLSGIVFTTLILASCGVTPESLVTTSDKCAKILQQQIDKNSLQYIENTFGQLLSNH